MDDFGRSPRVLVVEDDDEIAQVLQRSLRLDGYEVRVAGDGLKALEEANAFLPDLVILDLGLPKLDGIDVAKHLRERDDTPILMLTARDAVEARVEGLDSGADDYLVKPFELDELLARLRALLRRSGYAPDAPAGEPLLTFADLRMNPATREVTRGERAVELTRTEFTLLELLLAHPRQVLSREQILHAVWGFDYEPASNSLDVYIMYLRRKTEAGGEPRLVQTVRGVGYALREPR
jgi:two-component system, OmpR family, response regulator MprA